jgi:iron complex outermembrane receptor protein
MVGRRGSINIASVAWCLFLVLCVIPCLIETTQAEPQKMYDIHLPAQSVADALNGLSLQTGVPVVFPFDLAKNRKSHPVIGQYALLDALNALLEDTGLSGGLSDKGVVTISVSKSRAQQQGETSVTQNEKGSTSNNSAKAPKVAGIAAFFASMAAVFSANGQVADSQVSASQSANLEEVVVTAQKRTERLQDVPVSMSVINATSLTDTNQVLVKDYYSSVPGLNFAPAFSSQAYYTIRGIGTGSGAPTTAITIDDVPFGPTTDWAGGTFTPDIDPGDLERVEILRGPQGTLYGANSEGGLIKFVTKDPSTDALSGRFEAGADKVYNGAEPGYNMRASANIPVSDTLAVRVSGFDRVDPGYIDNPVYHINGVNETDTYGGRVSSLWLPSGLFSLKIGAMLQHTQSDGSSEAVDLPGLGPLQNNYLAGIGGTDTTIQAYSAVLKAKLGAGVNFTSVTGYTITDHRPTLDFSSFIDPSKIFGVTGTAFFYHIPTRTFTQEIRLNGSVGNVDWLVGGFYQQDMDRYRYDINAVNAITLQYAGNLEDAFDPRSDSTTAGFADVTYHLTDNFEIQAGGRESFDSIKLTPEVYSGADYPTPVTAPEAVTRSNTFTYLLTPKLTISQNLMLYARLASGYRPGGQNSAAAVAQGGPSSYAPDKTQNYEIGMKGDFLDQKLSVDLSLYHIKWQDLQITVLAPNKINNYNSNGGSAKSDGVELSLQIRPISGLSIGGWVSFDDVVLTQDFPAAATVQAFSGDRLPLSSRLSENLSIDQEATLWGETRGFIGGMVSRVGDRLGPFTSNDERQLLPAYTKTDLHAGVKYDTWTTTLYANNVSNTLGLLNGGLGYLYPPARFYITPRTIGLTVVKTF